MDCKYSTNVAASTKAVDISQLDTWLFNLHDRINKIEDLNNKLIFDNLTKDEKIKSLEKKFKIWNLIRAII